MRVPSAASGSSAVVEGGSHSREGAVTPLMRGLGATVVDPHTGGAVITARVVIRDLGHCVQVGVPNTEPSGILGGPSSIQLVSWDNLAGCQHVFDGSATTGVGW